MGLRHGTLLGVPYALRTSGIAFPFVLERLSNTPARLQEASPRTPDLTAVRGDREQCVGVRSFRLLSWIVAW